MVRGMERGRKREIGLVRFGERGLLRARMAFLGSGGDLGAVAVGSSRDVVLGEPERRMQELCAVGLRHGS